MMTQIHFNDPATLLKTAQDVEQLLHKEGHRLMNLQTPHGPVDLAHVTIHHLPRGYRQAHVGYLISATVVHDLAAIDTR